MIASADNFHESLGFFDTEDAVEVLKLYKTSAATYVLAPSEDGIASMSLGDHTDNDLRFDEVAGAHFYERNDAGLGWWTSPAFFAGDFTASAGTWTVDAGDVTTYAYTVVGKTMHLAFNIGGTDVSAGAFLKLAIPGGFVAAKEMRATYQAIDAGAAAAVGLAQVTAGGTVVNLFATIAAGNFAITAGDNTTVVGEIFFEVQ